MIYHYMEQGSPEWFAIRELKLTASKAQAIGNAGAGLETLVRELVRAHVSIEKKKGFVSEDIDRGHELEPIAIMQYEFEKNVETEVVGFIEYSKYVGVSPDRLVGLDGLLECKARNDDKHFDLLVNGKVDSAAIWQMNMQMLCSGRKWCDFISYNPNFSTSLFVKRFYPDEEKIKKLLVGFKKGQDMIVELLETPAVKVELQKKLEYLSKLSSEEIEFSEIEQTPIITEVKPEIQIKENKILKNSSELFG